MRYSAIDALRGFAALWVALYHLYGAADSPWSLIALESGHLGVFVFFVLSGFVIAKNLSGPIDGRTVVEFALRRSVRLDPTYWTMIAVTLIAEAYAERSYSPLTILGNMLYLDNLLGLDSIVRVGWTLCFEVQFYFVYALIAWTCSTPFVRTRNLRRAAPFAVLLAASLLVPTDGTWFLSGWFAFFLGVTIWWAVAGEATTWLPLAASVAILAFRPNAEGLTTVATGLLILGLVVRRRLNAFDLPILQFFGRISYSLYLIHPLVARFVRRFDGPPLVVFSVGVVGSVLAGYLLYKIVEAPTHRWARKIRLGRPHPSAESEISLTA